MPSANSIDLPVSTHASHAGKAGSHLVGDVVACPVALRGRQSVGKEGVSQYFSVLPHPSLHCAQRHDDLAVVRIGRLEVVCSIICKGKSTYHQDNVPREARTPCLGQIMHSMVCCCSSRRMLLIPLNFSKTNPEAAEAPEDPGPAAGATSAARNPRYQEAIKPCHMSLKRLKLSLLVIGWHP